MRDQLIEVDMLLQLVGIREGQSAAIATEEDWGRVLALATANGVVSHLHAALKSDEKRPRAAEVTWAYLKQRERPKTLQSMRLRAQLAKLLAAFRDADIDVIPLKGPLLAEAHYEHPGLREFGDLDILVRPSDLDRSRELMAANGYHSPYLNPDLHLRYHIVYFHNKVNCCVELHWRIAGPQYGRYYTGDFLWENLEENVAYGQPLRLPGPEAQILYLAIHAYKHDWARLQWLWDFREVLRSHPEMDWQGLHDLATEHHASRLLRGTLQIVKTLFPDSAAPPSGSQLNRTVLANRQLALVWRRLFAPHKGDRPIREFFELRVALAETWRDRLRLTWSRLVPSDRDHELVLLPKSLGLIYAVVRPIRIIYLLVRGKPNREQR